MQEVGAGGTFCFPSLPETPCWNHLVLRLTAGVLAGAVARLQRRCSVVLVCLCGPRSGQFQGRKSSLWGKISAFLCEEPAALGLPAAPCIDQLHPGAKAVGLLGRPPFMTRSWWAAGPAETQAVLLPHILGTVRLGGRGQGLCQRLSLWAHCARAHLLPVSSTDTYLGAVCARHGSRLSTW